MAAPTFIQEAETDWTTTTTPKTGTSRTYQDGDVLIGFGGKENDTAVPVLTLSGGTGFTWSIGASQDPNLDGLASYGRIWSATVVGGQTFQPSFARDVSSTRFGGNVLTFRASDGVGAVASTNNGTGSGAPSLDLTTTQDNSAIVMFVADWNAVSGASRAYRSVNGATPVEVTYDNSGAGSSWVMYGAYYADAGTAGLKTVGLSTPSTMRYVILAIEVKGTAGGGSDTPIAITQGTPALTGLGLSLGFTINMPAEA